MNISIVAVGKLRESFFKQACVEYEKRLSRFCKINITEVKDESEPSNPSSAQILQAKTLEGARLLSKIGERDTLIALSPGGKRYDSMSFSALIDGCLCDSGNVAFAIGGSNGLSLEVLNRAKHIVSFSDMTFPHALFRVMLLEQIYRAMKISANERYHK